MATRSGTGNRLVGLAAIVIVVAGACQSVAPDSSLAAASQSARATASTTAGVSPTPPLAASATAPSEPRCTFGPPENLGATINTAGFDGGPALSSDGLDLLFVSDRPGGNGGGDLWVARRQSPDAPFEPPANLGVGVNAVANEGAPTLSGDGLTLLFDRDDGGIWSASRPGATDAFGPATPVGPPVANPFGVGFPALAPDGRTLYYATQQPPGEGGLDIWQATRADASGPFTTAATLGRPVNLASADAMPGISADGLMLAFASRRDGGQGDWDLWLSERASVDGDFGSPMNPGPGLNTAGFDGRPAFAPDGSALFFMSDRPGGEGGTDIWRATMDCD